MLPPVSPGVRPSPIVAHPLVARAIRRALSLACCLAAATLASAQRPLTHGDYDQWKSLRGAAISQDGQWVAYQIEPEWGDGVLEIRQTSGDVVYRHPLGAGARFSSGNRFVVFNITKSKVEERQKKIDDLRKKNEAAKSGEKKEPENLPAGAPERGAAGNTGAGRRGAGAPGARRGAGAAGAGADNPDEASRERGDLGILDLATGKVEVVKRVKGFALPEELPVLIYHLDKPEPAAAEDTDAESRPGGESRPAGESRTAASRPSSRRTGEAAGEESRGAESSRGRAGRRGPRSANGNANGRSAESRGESRPESRAESRPEDPLEKKRQDGTDLVVRDLVTGTERRFPDVVGYGLTRKATWLWFHTSAKKPDEKKTYGLFATKPAGGDVRTLVSGFADFNSVTSDREGTVLAFNCNQDDFAAEKPRNDVWLWACNEQPAERIVHPGTPGMPAAKVASGSLSFCRDGSVLALSIQDPPDPEIPAVLPEEKVVLDLWHWNDPELQTAQAKRPGRRHVSWTAVWHRADRRLQVLGDTEVEQVRLITPDGSRGIGMNETPYEKLTTWDGRYSDVYLVNTIDGTRTKILEKLRGNVSNSPHGRYITWFDTSYHWWSLDVGTLQKRDLTGAIPVPFHRSDDDHPGPDPAWGIAGWTEHDQEVVINDEFDLWRVSPSTGATSCVTDGYGRAEKMRLRVEVLDSEQEFLPSQLLLNATNVETMATGCFTDSLTEPVKPRRLLMMDKALGGIIKAKKADRVIFTLATFAEFPDLWTAGLAFSDLRRLSTANPQQSEFRWGKAELVRWINGDGKELKGILVKPDGFDPSHKYPLIVNMYERLSQGLHNYHAPSPGTSPNPSYYVSNGYAWFMPDIVYDVGYPGESCVKCVVSGVQSLIARGFVDEKAIAATGHSWGGYQAAFLVTRTDIFAAVEAGAPVSDMVSAYGGIRYESGVSRQFQYEKDQSRIGGTPWQYPLRYWENSPIFFADKVRTPVLILHNDADGAVPWTNGLEYFLALRRLGKEAYLFNYSGEGHGLTKRQNQKDWTRRMAEYFAHHLKHEPAPAWMDHGVPFAERDKEKLPHTPSYAEIMAKPPESRPVAGGAKAEVPSPAEKGQDAARPTAESRPAK